MDSIALGLILFVISFAMIDVGIRQRQKFTPLSIALAVVVLVALIGVAVYAANH